ncbi:MAG: succinylglutamate desuccinylase/aspartoacylase family protein [Bdellovibrionaceae bacterium]|nr:succinylglutamate desuccinylase/aspartoacylase family protein [Bdellovibrionales bacterium]MCB9083399.1 succinylglutamate desuccinylase/aspartoacylase family protein [Pseudobdellovibrionaceae bacterium]
MKPLVIAEKEINPGERKRFVIEVARLYDFTTVGMPVEVIRGKEPGPTLFVTGAIHGDEINGVEIIRRLLRRKDLAHLRGTLIAVPIVNVFGFNNKSRYLPDRRDLNRSFPGNEDGSLAARLAHILLNEIILQSTHGIDLHTAAIHRQNLPHIRTSLGDQKAMELAEVFGAPLILHSESRDGSLREMAFENKIPILLFEGGEALRFEEHVIRSGLQGCMRVMRAIDMLPPLPDAKPRKKPFLAKASHWLRAPRSGCLRLKKHLGDLVKEGEILGVVSDPFDRDREEIVAKKPGVIIGVTSIPLVNQGDAILHLATGKDVEIVQEFLGDLWPDS